MRPHWSTARYLGYGAAIGAFVLVGVPLAVSYAAPAIDPPPQLEESCRFTAFTFDIGGEGLKADKADQTLPVTVPAKKAFICTRLDANGLALETETGTVTDSDFTLNGTCDSAFVTGTATITWQKGTTVVGTSKGFGALAIRMIPKKGQWMTEGGVARVNVDSVRHPGAVFNIPPFVPVTIPATDPQNPTGGDCTTGVKQLQVTLTAMGDV